MGIRQSFLRQVDACQRVDLWERKRRDILVPEMLDDLVENLIGVRRPVIHDRTPWLSVFLLHGIEI